MLQNSTIAAIATPPGTGGIGIIKISGPDAFGIAKQIFINKARPGCEPPKFASHRLHYGRIVDPDSGQILDEVLLVLMQAPRSYTREDVVEIQAHAGPVALRAILDVVLHKGARMAEPGEFTRRAFLNGRIDLIQAEAIADLINARSETALKAAANQVEGRLTGIVGKIVAALNEMRIRIEAGIDFPEDVEAFYADAALIEDFKNQVATPIEDLIRRYTQEHVFRDGINLAIIGRPNVGKSSLMNALLEKDRAIVTETPGTTRDLVEDSMQILGIPINVIDTAGLHATTDPIEILGINKARQRIQNAHLILFVVEADRAPHPEDLEIHTTVGSKKMILVVNKIDRLQTGSGGYRLPEAWRGLPVASVSALHHWGIDTLKRSIAALVSGTENAVGNHSLIPNLRHKMALENCLKSVQAVTDGLTENRPAEIIALDLKAALDELGRMIGSKAEHELIDQIFNRFCIGK